MIRRDDLLPILARLTPGLTAGALLGRVQHMQRLGIHRRDGRVPEKGKGYRYSENLVWHICLINELQNLGLTPTAAIEVLDAHDWQKKLSANDPNFPSLFGGHSGLCIDYRRIRLAIQAGFFQENRVDDEVERKETDPFFTQALNIKAFYGSAVEQREAAIRARAVEVTSSLNSLLDDLTARDVKAVRDGRHLNEYDWSKIDNPPAYPVHPSAPVELKHDDYEGMSLRDYFAGHALAGICATTEDNFRGETSWELEAGDAYRAADAMLAARAGWPE